MNMLTATHDWMRLFEGETAGDLMRALPEILQARRWFGGKARRIQNVAFVDCIAIPSDSLSMLLLIRVEYEEAGIETYTLPVTAAHRPLTCRRLDAAAAASTSTATAAYPSTMSAVSRSSRLGKYR